MNVDELVRDALREQATEQAPAAGGFADRVLAVRRRRRNHRIVAAAVTAVVAVAVGVAVPLLDSGKQDVRPSGGVVVEQKGTKAHPDQSPPRDLISAGGTTLAGYYLPETVKTSDDTAVYQRTYWLLDRQSGKYEKDERWSWVAVAPGAKTAAVLERDLPASRIGLLDLTTGKVARWIDVDHRVAGLAFSRDGRKLVATTYGKNPDGRVKEAGSEDWGQEWTSSRTGFYVLDVASGNGGWTEVRSKSDSGGLGGGGVFMGSRQDFNVTDDGRHVWEGSPFEPGNVFYDLTGKKVSPAPGDKYLSSYVDAGKSPNGKLVAGDFAGRKWHTSSYVVDAMTGAKTEVRGQQLLAWVGDRQLIAWDIAGAKDSEFHQRLVLITIGSEKQVPLSGFREGDDGDPGRWEPLFAQP
ncbi:WD40 repeat domain-containing protein [Streptomyces sp. NPDC047072]|uniref:WD40 repeat domain-containing protein n=1 Tax=Streptomyces sp. NPDC047072 TaxID=3154809 RepID=UPI0033D2553D